jgi:hypothetical protein
MRPVGKEPPLRKGPTPVLLDDSPDDTALTIKGARISLKAPSPLRQNDMRVLKNGHGESEEA